MKRRSLGFGLNSVDPEPYNGWPGYLQACWADCSTTAARLATAGYEARGFFDEDCTLEKARTKIGEASSLSEPGDYFVFSDSGHGSQNPGPWFGTEEGLVLYDGILVDSEFRELLSKFKAGVNVVCILDVCHAGGLDRALLPYAPRVAPIRATRNAPGFTKAAVDISANVIIMAACQRDELSLDGTSNGAFTGSLLATLVEGMTWKTWMQATRRFMSEKFPSQHPELILVGGSGLENEQIA